MVKLLMRFYDVNNGSIKVDGSRRAELQPPGDLRELFRHGVAGYLAVSTAQSWRTSVTDDLDATDEEVIAAAKAAHADSFIRTLPGGYDMVLNEETSNISQGQKQLLTIARAILADPPDPDSG